MSGILEVYLWFAIGKNFRNNSGNSHIDQILSDVAVVNCDVARPVSSDLKVKGINCGHLNIQGIFGQNMSNFSELKLMSTAEENRNNHISLALMKRN